MDIKAIGEFGLIDLIKRNSIADEARVEIGIGDDAAAFWPPPERLQLVTADMLVETVHFDLQWISPWQLGFKALAVNISDIAAMGGTPRHAFVSIALPRHCSVDFVLALYEGMKAIGREYGVNILGGDTVSSPQQLVINVTLTGDVPPGRVLRRSGARPGDQVLVTNCLGNSSAGLEWLMAGGLPEQETVLVSSHLTPQPQVFLGQALAAAGATSMDDVSDGLSSEANEIAAASRAGIVLYADKIPLSDELRRYAARQGRNPLEYALYGGEDYQLLFTMPAAAAGEFCRSPLGQTCSPIGTVTDKPGVRLIHNDGSAVPLEPKGYNHFR